MLFFAQIQESLYNYLFFTIKNIATYASERRKMAFGVDDLLSCLFVCFSYQAMQSTQRTDVVCFLCVCFVLALSF